MAHLRPGERLSSLPVGPPLPLVWRNSAAY